MTRRARLAVAIAMLAIAQAGCGYSLAGRGSFLPAYIKRIGVPQFTNNTAVFELDRQVTERVRSEFIGRGKWTVVPDTTVCPPCAAVINRAHRLIGKLA